MAKNGKITTEICKNCEIHCKIAASTVKSEHRSNESLQSTSVHCFLNTIYVLDRKIHTNMNSNQKAAM